MKAEGGSVALEEGERDDPKHFSRKLDLDLVGSSRKTRKIFEASFAQKVSHFVAGGKIKSREPLI